MSSFAGDYRLCVCSALIAHGDLVVMYRLGCECGKPGIQYIRLCSVAAFHGPCRDDESAVDSG
jgi:hypothetical protein